MSFILTQCAVDGSTTDFSSIDISVSYSITSRIINSVCDSEELDQWLESRDLIPVCRCIWFLKQEVSKGMYNSYNSQ